MFKLQNEKVTEQEIESVIHYILYFEIFNTATERVDFFNESEIPNDSQATIDETISNYCTAHGITLGEA